MDYKIMWLYLKENMKTSTEAIDTEKVFNTMKSIELGKYNSNLVEFEINARSTWVKEFIGRGEIEEAIRIAKGILELKGQ